MTDGERLFWELSERGFIYQQTFRTEQFVEHMSSERTCYIGFDPTADSLHVGSLVPLMGLRHVKRAGHQVILLTGGGTALVGDPSGKTEMRRMISVGEIARNAEGIARQLLDIVDEGVEGKACLTLDNAQWLTRLSYIDFLREIGRHMSVNRMLARESARRRYDSAEGLTFLEFNYMCLQAYDFLHLYREHGCTVQMGGQDQWGNICEGIDLIARPELAGGRAYGLTFPLLAGPSGEKFGKTSAGAVWLDSRRTPPFDYYQFWRNCADDEVERYLLLFTELDVQTIRSQWDRNVNRSKEILAYECTRLVHGRATAQEVYATAVAQYRSADPEGTVTLGSDIPRAAGGAGEGSVPVVTVPAGTFPAGVLDLLVLCGLCRSKGEARRMIRQGGIYVDGERVSEEGMTVEAAGGGVLLAAGKKRRRRIVEG
jgi:tyrosyl-tRNA synthetase